MTYEYAAKKIEELFNKELEHVDVIRGMMEPDPDWVDRTIWISKMENVVNEFVAAGRVVIEIYIELSNCECKDWRELHKIHWSYAEKLKTEVSRNKEELDESIPSITF